MKMPIINLLIQNDSQANRDKTLSKDSRFEAMLKENAYYRSHQSHWEQSELKFEQRTLNRTPILKETAQTYIKKQTQDKTLLNHQDKAQLQIDKNTLKLPQAPVYHTNSMQGQDFKLLHTKTQNLTVWLDTLNRFLETLDRTQEHRLKIKEKHRIEFSNHQLFIDGHKARLSLQSLKLSKHELKNLIDAVKILLKQRKITLEHIVINGESYD